MISDFILFISSLISLRISCLRDSRSPLPPPAPVGGNEDAAVSWPVNEGCRFLAGVGEFVVPFTIFTGAGGGGWEPPRLLLSSGGVDPSLLGDSFWEAFFLMANFLARSLMKSPPPPPPPPPLRLALLLLPDTPPLDSSFCVFFQFR